VSRGAALIVSPDEITTVLRFPVRPFTEAKQFHTCHWSPTGALTSCQGEGHLPAGDGRKPAHAILRSIDWGEADDVGPFRARHITQTRSAKCAKWPYVRLPGRIAVTREMLDFIARSGFEAERGPI
jgi:hypothetical protein